MKFVLFGALLAATCQQSTPSPAPTPVPVPEPTSTVTSDPTPLPVPQPGTQCEVAWAVQADAECAPAQGHDAWLAGCAKLSAKTVACVMSVDSCAAMRACLETP